MSAPKGGALRVAAVPWSAFPRELHDDLVRLARDAGLIDHEFMLLDLVHLADVASHPNARRRRRVPSKATLSVRWGVSTRRAYAMLLEARDLGIVDAPARAVVEDGSEGNDEDRAMGGPESGHERTGSGPGADHSVKRETPQSAESGPNADRTRTERGPKGARASTTEPPNPPIPREGDLIPFPGAVEGVAVLPDDPPTLRPSTRAALVAAGLRGGNDLANLAPSEVLALPAIGPTRLDEIVSWLAYHGLSLAPEPRSESGLLDLARGAWDAVWSDLGRGSYPWLLGAHGADRRYLRRWVDAFDLRRREQDGVAHLTASIRAYVAAVAAGTAWPRGEPATTAGFSGGSNLAIYHQMVIPGSPSLAPTGGLSALRLAAERLRGTP